MKISVVIATYNRLHLLLDLLADLGRQTLDPHEFEVIVVDDGSRVPVEPRLAELSTPYSLVVRAQANSGAASARHAGAVLARGDILLTLDDDMTVGPDFLDQHLAAHERGATLVQGHIAPPPDSERLPLFERFHAGQIERFVHHVQSGRERFRGIHVCTGNLSMRRADYLAVGGFDRELVRSEDRELGVRLEKAGARLTLAVAARSWHRSDHDSLEAWLRRSHAYGIYDLRIARKHPEVPSADPWRFLFLVSPVSKPLLLGAVLSPEAGERLARAAFAVSRLVDRGPGRGAAVAGATLAYGLEYFSGLRREYGSAASALSGLAAYVLGKLGSERPASGPGARLLASVRADFAALARVRAKYNADLGLSFDRLPVEAARKVGLQMMVATRLMRFLRDAVHPLAAQAASRLIRHAYGAEIHWNAELEPGVVIIHGNGLVIGHGARIGEGCILFHNVTLGEGMDPDTRQQGAPTLERDVHVGPGCTVIGPIVVGEGTKLMAGSVLTHSVPPRSLVRPPETVVQQRPAAAADVRRLHTAEAAS